MRSKRLLLGGAVVGIGIITAAFFFMRSSSESAKGRGPGQANRTAGMRLPVIGVVIQAIPFDNTIQATGSIMASEEVELRTEVAGKVIALPFREGSKVRKGDLLVKINDAELQAQLTGSRSRLAFAVQKVERQRKLKEINAVSEEQMEEARNEVTSMQSTVSLMEAQLNKTEIHAPFAGVIGLRFISEGSYISSSTLVARLQDVSYVKVDFSVPEKYAPQVHVGMGITFTIEGTSTPFKGTVYAMEPKIDPATRSLRVRARASNAEGRMLPGSFTKVLLVLQRLPDAILVPTQALLPDIEGQKVYVVRNGTARLIPVEAGMRTQNKIQILSGLRTSDTLLTTGLLQLRDGSPVQVTLQN